MRPPLEMRRRGVVFVVFATTGLGPEDSYRWPVRAFPSKEQADAFVDECNERADKVQKRVERLRERERDGSLEWDAYRAAEVKATRAVWKFLNNAGDDTTWDRPVFDVDPVPFTA